MTTKKLIIPSLVLAATISITGAVLSQDRQDAPAARDLDPMRAMMPGKAHQRLTRYVGEYDVTSRFVMPGMDPMETSGSATVKSALGDRFIVVESQGTMMGQPYTSVQWYGHNNFGNRYESVWMYTMGTSMMNLVGESNDDGATVTWKASYHGPAGKEAMDIITRFPDADRFMIEMRHEGDEEGPVMITTYTRKQ